jgi:5-formyltetrahydrofolate cyclo-ligase
MTGSKSDLREEFKRRRREIPEAAYAEMNAEIIRRLLADPAVAHAKTIFSYIAFGREADTRPALKQLLEAGRRVVAPPEDRVLDPLRCFRFLVPGAPLLKPGGRQAGVTPDTCDLLDLNDVDLFIVPGIVWDPSGYRIGFGGGYFDRLLERAREGVPRIGLAFELQMTGEVPRDRWDQPVDTILTELREIDARAVRYGGATGRKRL